MGKKGKLRKQLQKKNQPIIPPAPAQGDDEVLGRLSDAPIIGQDTSAPTNRPNNMPTGTGDPLSDLLGGMMGGQGGMPAGGDLGSILGGILGGMDPSTQNDRPTRRSPASSSSSDPMGDLFGSILGGGGSPGSMPQGSGDPLGSILGGMFGGGGQMGASGGMGGLGSVLSPLADALSSKTGIPREIAMAAMSVIVPMVLNKIMSSGQENQGQALASLSSGSIPGSGLHFSSDEKREMAQQLTVQTGLDHGQATQTLNQAIQVLESN